MKLSRSLIGLAFILVLCVLGLILGGLIATTFFMPANAMGFDALATAMGGWMIGTPTALVLGILLYRKLSTRGLLIGLGLALVAIVLVVAVLRMQLRMQQAQRQAERNQSSVFTRPLSSSCI